MRNYICAGNKYFFGNGYIATPVDVGKIPQNIIINENKLFLKSSFHVSLVCVKEITKKYGDEFEQKVSDFFCDFVSKNQISFIRYKDEFRHAIDEKTGRETLVVMCDVLNISEFFEALNKKFGFEMEVPPTHVTLYTLQQDKGIGLNTSFDIKNKTSMLTTDILKDIKDRIY